MFKNNVIVFCKTELLTLEILHLSAWLSFFNFYIETISNPDANSFQRFFKQHSSNQNSTNLSSILPRTPKDVTLTPINTEGNAVIDASDCHQVDNVAIEDDKMLFAGLSVSELTSVDHVEDGIAANSMSNLFPEQKIVTEPSVSEVFMI